MTQETAKKLLASLYVPRTAPLKGKAFSDDYMRADKDSDKYAIYEAVSTAQRDSGLSFDFAYIVGEKAADILAEADNWDDDDDINERIDSAVPVYTSEIMEIYAQNHHIVDDAAKEISGTEGNSEAAAQLGWYKAISDMVSAIRSNLDEIISDEEEAESITA